jgi:hypothetical protein
MNLLLANKISEHEFKHSTICRVSEKLILLCLLVVLIRSLAGSALAADSIHNWYFTGTVTSVDPRETFAHVGDPYVLSIGIDTAAANNTGISFPVVGMGISVYHVGIGASLIGGEAFVGNDMPRTGGGTFDCFYLNVQSNYGSPTYLALDGTDLGITLINTSQSSTPGPFNSRNFPTTIDLSAFNQRYMNVNFFYGPMRGTIDAVYFDQIPEPGIPSLIAIGFLFCSRWMLRIEGTRRKPKSAG